MGQWKNPPLQNVTFRLGFPVNLGIEQRVAQFQRDRGYLAEVVLRQDEKRPHRGLVPEYRLVHPEDTNFVITVTHADAHFIENDYTDWHVFRDKVLDHLAITPIPDETEQHDFIGLACLDRLAVFPTQDGSIPVDRYLKISMKGPGEFFDKKFQHAAWETDYQMAGPRDLLRYVVRSERADEEGIEHLVVSVDRRVGELSSQPVEEFLEAAHRDTKEAFESILQPDYLTYLKEGSVPDGSDFSPPSAS